MNVLYAIHHFPPNYTGGAEWRAHRTASAVQRKGYSVSIVCIEQIEYGKPSLVSVKNDRFGELPVFRLAVRLDVRPGRLGYHYQNPLLGDTIKQLLSESKADIFHQFGGYLMNVNALQAAREMKIPSIVSLTDFWYFCPRIQMIRSNGDVCPFPIEDWQCARCLGEESRRYRLPGQLFPRLMEAHWKKQKKKRDDLLRRSNLLVSELNQASLIISPSNFVRDAYISQGIDAPRILYSRQGVDLSGFPKEISLKQSSHTLRVGYIGQITPIKGIHIVIEAMKLLGEAPIRLRIYGDLTKDQAYVRRLRESSAGDPRIEYMGIFNRPQLVEVMSEMDILIVPSLWYENSPNVVQEAFATRTPVVASNLGGMAELIDHGKNGLLFKVGDPADLAGRLQELIADKNVADAFKRNVSPVKSVEMEIDELEKHYLAVTGKEERFAYRH